jgi:hypothetical protein
MEISSQHFSNLGFLSVELTDNDVKPIVEETIEIYKNFQKATRFNQGLAGHLNNEYHLFKCKSYIEKLLLPLVYEYKNTFSGYECKNEGYFLENTWVNFQKKHEFNPVHHHLGIFSFALWLRIPYYIEDEYKTFPNINPGENITANFCFQYIDALGEIQRCPIPADKTYENKLLFFPAKMRHFVNPFYTSDEYRISVSGNFA